MRIAFFFSLLLAATIYALWRGGAPERSVAASYFVIGAIGSFWHDIAPRDFQEMEIQSLVVDIAIWIPLFIVSLGAKRIWPLWVVAFQTIAVVAHTAKLMDVSIIPRAYYIMQVASSYPLLITLIIGTYCHQKRLQKFGTDPSWRRLSLRSPLGRPQG